MTVFEHAGRLLIVDCGVLFPEPDQPGVDLILPDFSYIEDRLDQVEALVITHAHEDHIGAIPFLLRLRDDIPLVGSKLTLALVASKLTEHRITPEALEVSEGGRVSFGPFDLEFFAVNHSIPDALAVGIRTRAGLVLHTGDFKMDQLPLDGRLTDLGGFARLGAEGVDLLMADSTNAEIPGIVTTEQAIGPVLNRGLRRGQAADHRLLLRQPRAPGAAGARRRGRARAQGGAGRPVDGAEHGGRPRARLPAGPLGSRWPDRGAARGRGTPARGDRADLHGVAGRADVRAGPDGRPGPPDQDRRGRHGDPGVVAGAGQRDCRVPDHQRPDPARRDRGAPRQRAGARVRARTRRGTALRAEPGAAQQLHPGARGVAAPAGARGSRRTDRRAGQEHRDRRGRRGGRPRRTARPRSPGRCTAAMSSWTGFPSAR